MSGNTSVLSLSAAFRQQQHIVYSYSDFYLFILWLVLSEHLFIGKVSLACLLFCWILLENRTHAPFQPHIHTAARIHRLKLFSRRCTMSTFLMGILTILVERLNDWNHWLSLFTLSQHFQGFKLVVVQVQASRPPQSLFRLFFNVFARTKSLKMILSWFNTALSHSSLYCGMRRVGKVRYISSSITWFVLFYFIFMVDIHF